MVLWVVCTNYVKSSNICLIFDQSLIKLFEVFSFRPKTILSHFNFNYFKVLYWQLTSCMTSQVTPCAWHLQLLQTDVFDREAAITAVAMGTTTSEPCIYDKLSESIDILRQSGYRYGMSEREIERFIKQVLETNEPRREPPQFPILRATIKVRHPNMTQLVNNKCNGLIIEDHYLAFLTVIMSLSSMQFVVAVGFLLVVVLAFTYPQNTPQLGLVNLGCYNWSSPLSHVRLLSLPIAKKYNLQGVVHDYSLFFFLSF